MTHPRRLRALRALVLSASFLVAAPAFGQSAADDYFERGLTALRQKDYATACPLLEKSLALDPAMGTRYRLGECYEGAGKVASALEHYEIVVAEATAASRADRATQAAERVAAVKPRVPYVIVQANAPAGAKVELDGAPFKGTLGKPHPVDPGSHVVVVFVSDDEKLTKKFDAVEGKSLTLAMEGPDAPPDPKAPPGAPVKPAPSGDDPGAGQRIGGVVTIAIGGAAIVVGAVLGGIAGATWSDALSHCTAEDVTRCDDEGISLGDKANTQALVSTIMLPVGVAAAGIGLVVFFTAPSASASTTTGLRPFVSTHAAGLTVFQSF